jgi:hypothetical protein
MGQKQSIVILLTLTAPLLAACAPGALSPPTPAAKRNTITDFAALVEAFKGQGAAAEAGEEIFDPTFSVKGRFLNLPRDRVEVMEYPTEAEAQAEGAKISPDGLQVGDSAVDWVDAPHFFRANQLIVLYVGRDETTLDLLAGVLGPQFAGGAPRQPTPTIVYAPTAHAPTSAPAFDTTPDLRTPTMIPPDLGQATIAARATASPFPTANAVAIIPREPAHAIAQRDGLSFNLEVPKDNYLAGEGAQARLTLRNDGAETLFIGVGHDLAQLILLDEQGHEPPPYPWYSAPRPGVPYLATLAPGAVITSTIPFHAPPTAPASEHHYVLWAFTKFSRLAPENGNGPDNIWLHLESGPIPLNIATPDPSQHLNARLEADYNGWHIKVVDSQGQVPNAPPWGAMEAATYGGLFSSPLNENAEGQWSGTWPDEMQGNETIVRAWLSAPGYVTAIANVMVPGKRSGQTTFEVMPPRLVLGSLDAARAAVKLPVAMPKQLPPGTTLDRAEVEDSTYDSNRRTFVWQLYRLAENYWLELTQMNWAEHFESAGWGQARYDPEAQRVTVSGATGYLVKQFDWWVLDWKIGGVGFELHAPAISISREQLLSIAESVQP